MFTETGAAFTRRRRLSYAAVDAAFVLYAARCDGVIVSVRTHSLIDTMEVNVIVREQGLIQELAASSKQTAHGEGVCCIQRSLVF